MNAEQCHDALSQSKQLHNRISVLQDVASSHNNPRLTPYSV